MDVGAYDLGIDDGKELQLMNQEEWPRVVQCDTTIIMSIVITQLAYHKKYQCPLCDFWNVLNGNHGGSSIDWWDFHCFPYIFAYRVLAAPASDASM